jgi:hypothetical protein
MTHEEQLTIVATGQMTAADMAASLTPDEAKGWLGYALLRSTPAPEKQAHWDVIAILPTPARVIYHETDDLDCSARRHAPGYRAYQHEER